MVPSTEDSLRATFTSKAGQVLPSITQDLVASLECEEDQSAVVAVGDALARAFMEGTAVGATEMVAQAAERGTVIKLHWLGGPGSS
jgi:uncharacterized protein (UPF0218 family)